MNSESSQDQVKQIEPRQPKEPRVERGMDKSFRLEHLQENVVVFAVVITGVACALYSGHLAGTGNTQTLVKMAALVITAIVCFTMRTRVWMLIPLGWSLSGQMNSLPGRFPVRDVLIIFVFLLFCTFRAFKLVTTKARYGWLDLVILINLLYILSVYIRNPVGTSSMGTGKMGGKPYLEVVFAVMGFWVLNQVHLSPKTARRLPVYALCVVLGVTALNIFVSIFPSAAPIIGNLYNGISVGDGAENAADMGRTQFLTSIAGSGIATLCGYYSPLTVINPLSTWRFAIFFVLLYAAGKSGHRVTAPFLAFILYLSAYFRRGFHDVVILSIFLIPPVVLILAAQGNMIELPLTLQRSLSFLPAKWNPEALENAQGSTEWRMDMWREMMHGDKYIKNKLLGDGFGFTLEQARNMADDSTQENFMITGDVHSGPISAIRFVGYVGLALFFVLTFGLARRAVSVINAAKGTPYFPLALCVGIPTIYHPIGFIFIFGAYGADIPVVLINAAMLNLISNALTVYRQEEEIETVAAKRNALNPIPQPIFVGQ